MTVSLVAGHSQFVMLVSPSQDENPPARRDLAHVGHSGTDQGRIAE